MPKPNYSPTKNKVSNHPKRPPNVPISTKWIGVKPKLEPNQKDKVHIFPSDCQMSQ